MWEDWTSISSISIVYIIFIIAKKMYIFIWPHFRLSADVEKKNIEICNLSQSIKILSKNNQLLKAQIDYSAEADTRIVLTNLRQVLIEFKQLASDNISQAEYVKTITNNLITKNDQINRENEVVNNKDQFLKGKNLLENLNNVKESIETKKLVEKTAKKVDEPLNEPKEEESLIVYDLGE